MLQVFIVLNAVAAGLNLGTFFVIGNLISLLIGCGNAFIAGVLWESSHAH